MKTTTLLLTVLCVASFLASCSMLNLSPCSQEIFDRFKQTEVVEMVKVFSEVSNMGKSVTDSFWIIEPRGRDGCVVAYHEVVNSEELIPYTFFINLETETIHPDNNASSEVFSVLWIGKDLSNGLPLP